MRPPIPTRWGWDMRRWLLQNKALQCCLPSWTAKELCRLTLQLCVSRTCGIQMRMFMQSSDALAKKLNELEKETLARRSFYLRRREKEVYKAIGTDKVYLWSDKRIDDRKGKAEKKDWVFSIIFFLILKSSWYS